jgi:hypothetical protein
MEFRIFGSKSLIESVYYVEDDNLVALTINTRERWVGFQVGATSHTLAHQPEIWKIDESGIRTKQIDLWIDEENSRRDIEKEESATLLLLPSAEEYDQIKFNGFCAQNKEQIDIVWLKRLPTLKRVDFSE